MASTTNASARSTKAPYRTYLSESQIPTQYYNLRADMPTKPEPMRLPNGVVAEFEHIAPVFAEELVRQELDDDTAYVDIPEGVREMYKVYRPSPLCRAYNLEQALGTPAHIYYKFEGNNTSGSHKLNSALAQAYYAYQQGLTTITTETGAGQWGTALSEAAAHYGLDNLCVIVDHNGLQISGQTKDVMSYEPVDQHFAGFNWAVKSIDGNSMEEVVAALDSLPFEKGRPSLILANTVKGLGYPKIAGTAGCHFWAYNEEGYNECMEALDRMSAEVEA